MTNYYREARGKVIWMVIPFLKSSLAGNEFGVSCEPKGGTKEDTPMLKDLYLQGS